MRNGVQPAPPSEALNRYQNGKPFIAGQPLNGRKWISIWIGIGKGTMIVSPFQLVVMNIAVIRTNERDRWKDTSWSGGRRKPTRLPPIATIPLLPWIRTTIRRQKLESNLKRAHYKVVSLTSVETWCTATQLTPGYLNEHTQPVTFSEPGIQVWNSIKWITLIKAYARHQSPMTASFRGHVAVELKFSRSTV